VHGSCDGKVNLVLDKVHQVHRVHVGARTGIPRAVVPGVHEQLARTLYLSSCDRGAIRQGDTSVPCRPSIRDEPSLAEKSPRRPDTAYLHLEAFQSNIVLLRGLRAPGLDSQSHHCNRRSGSSACRPTPSALSAVSRSPEIPSSSGHRPLAWSRRATAQPLFVRRCHASLIVAIGLRKRCCTLRRSYRGGLQPKRGASNDTYTPQQVLGRAPAVLRMVVWASKQWRKHRREGKSAICVSIGMSKSFR
jgi:hypothetical protein